MNLNKTILCAFADEADGMISFGAPEVTVSAVETDELNPQF